MTPQANSTFNTSFCRYRRLRKPFGVFSTPEELQKRMRDHYSAFGDIKGTAVIADEKVTMTIWSPPPQTLTRICMRIILERATLNKAKIRLRLTEGPYCIGHLLAADGPRPDPKKLEAILMMPKPTDVQSVKRLLRMENYFSKFLPHLSSHRTTEATRGQGC